MKRRVPKVKPEYHHVALECGHIWGMGKNVTPEEVKCPKCDEFKQVVHVFPW